MMIMTNVQNKTKQNKNDYTMNIKLRVELMMYKKLNHRP
jgi:hypothetical protein